MEGLMKTSYTTHKKSVLIRLTHFFGAILLAILMVPVVAFSQPATPTLATPVDAAQNQQLAPTLTWNASGGATSYQLQVSNVNDFSTTVYNDMTLTGTSTRITGLYYETTYYWHVSAKNGGGTSAYSATQSFITGPSPVNLLSLGRFAILAYSAVTNVPTSAITGDLGLSPAAGSFYSGFGLTEVTGGMYAVDATGPAPVQMNKALVDQAQLDLGTASVNAAGRTPVPTGTFLNPGSGDLSGLTLPGGLYKFTGTCLISGSVTLTGSVTDVWIFQIASDLSIPNGGIQVVLAGDAKASNIFWVTGTAATIGTTDVVKGTIMAHSAVTMATGATLDGRALAATANVTLQSNTITTTAVLPLSLNLRTSASFGVLSGAGVTGTGSITENIGTTTSTIAAPITATGTKYEGTSEVTTAHTDLNTAYLDAAGRNTNVTTLSGGAFELGGTSQTPGVYSIGGNATINGTLTLNGAGIYIFQVSGTLTTATSSNVSLINGAQWQTIYWQVGGTDATLGASSTFNGNLLANKSISVGNGAAVTGRLLAGAVDAAGTVSINNATVLPVELAAFTASSANAKTALTWTTATEVNNYGFEIERRLVNNQSSTLNSWMKIGFVKGSGTSNNEHSYSYIDANVSSGTYAYRLKQIDNNGTFKYSGEAEVTIAVPKVLALNQNYPNPFNPTTMIAFTLAQDGFTTLKIYDVLGREVATLVNGEMKAGIMNTVNFNASKLSSGVYFSRLESSGNIQIKKMLLMK
jgi:hypothetical protein